MIVRIAFFAIFFYLFCLKVNAQQKKIQSINEDSYTLPCYFTVNPKIVNLPDSFRLKQRNYKMLFDLDCYFDSLGNVMEIIPFEIFIMDKSNGELIQKFIYRIGWEDSAINISKAEAERYVTWVKKALPQIVHLRRSPFRCDEKRTNRIIRSIELRLE